MSNLSQAENYLLHCSGVHTMLAWMENQKSLGTGAKVAFQTIRISQLGSRYFGLAKSNHKKGNLPFLCIQPNESQWIKTIKWDYAAIRKDDNYLYLVSSIVKGDDVEYPDIPSFAVGIEFDDIEKLTSLDKFNKLDGREFFIDTNGAIRVNYHQKIFSLPLKHLEINEGYLNEGIVMDYTELFSRKEEILQSIYSTNNPPEFLGDIADIPESKSLYQKLKDKLL